MHTKQTGDLAEAKFLSRCLERGYIVSQPFGENQRYDLIVDRDNTLYKVQVKASYPIEKNAVLVVETCSSNQHNGRVSYKKDNVDIFGVYSRETKKCYWIPFDVAPATQMNLRITPTENNQGRGVHFAKDYEF